jgi:hypothetical protein
LSGTGRSRCPTVAAPNQEGCKCSARGEASRRTTTSHSAREVGSRRSTREAAEQSWGCNSSSGGGGGGKAASQGECCLVAHMPHFEADNRCEAVRHATGATSVASDRWNLRQEPYAVAPHVRICGGGAGRPASLLRRGALISWTKVSWFHDQGSRRPISAPRP